jgi:hypothetical protein
MLPHFDEAVPLYDPRFEPIWATAEELQMPVGGHLLLQRTIYSASRSAFHDRGTLVALFATSDPSGRRKK